MNMIFNPTLTVNGTRVEVAIEVAIEERNIFLDDYEPKTAEVFNAANQWVASNTDAILKKAEEIMR